MNKFNEVAQTILKEEENNFKIEDFYREASNILTKKGLKGFDQNEFLEIIKKAYILGRKEKAVEENPFK